MKSIAHLLNNHNLNEAFEKIRARLAEYDFVCWLAGGAVRDFLIGREVFDLDLVTDANSEALARIFPEALSVGVSYGVFKIPVSAGVVVDLTTFREEGDYLDGRRPSSVSASTPIKDAQRRDFSINGLFWDSRIDRVWDYVVGLEDLQNRILTCVGSAEVRFNEDYLRILRLVRFSAQLDFSIDPQTESAAQLQVQKISDLSVERVWSELKKISTGEMWTRAFSMPLFCKIFENIFGVDVAARAKMRLTDLSDNSLILFLILASFGKTFDESILKDEMKVSKKDLAHYRGLVQCLYLQVDTPAEVAYELEKKPELKNYFQILIESGLVSARTLSDAENVLMEHNKVFFTAAELSKLVPPQQTNNEYRLIRISQFNGNYKSKTDVYDYLSLKYAVKFENT